MEKQLEKSIVSPFPVGELEEPKKGNYAPVRLNAVNMAFCLLWLSCPMRTKANFPISWRHW